MRKPLVAGNWKMNLLRAEAEALVRGLVSELNGRTLERVDVAVFPAFPLIPIVAPLLSGTPVRLGGQNVAWEEKGAFTGEVSAAMLKDFGCEMVLVGHSERRHILSESDDLVRRRLHRALASGLKPILCVGETLEERKSGRAFEVVLGQLRSALEGRAGKIENELILAYEPVWAIGTGENATPEQAGEMHAGIREAVSKIGGRDMSESIRILYGGSVTPENVRELMAVADVDGVLVGGASLKAEKFARIVAEAAAAAR